MKTEAGNQFDLPLDLGLNSTGFPVELGQFLEIPDYDSFDSLVTTSDISSDPSSSPLDNDISKPSSPLTSPMQHDLFGVFPEPLPVTQLPLEQHVLDMKREPLSSLHFGIDLSNTPAPGSLPPKDTQRKRKKQDELDIKITSAETPLELTREQLLQLSSKGLDDYARKLAQARPLTAAEEKQLKKQRRLIKNRESAQLSRQRKKKYIEGLEMKVNELSTENEKLRSLVETLSRDNTNLRTEVTHLNQVIATNSSGEKPVLTNTKTKLIPKNLTRNIKAGVTMFLVLFSFGLLLNSGYQNQLPFQHREPIPEVVPSGAFVGRTLQSFDASLGEEMEQKELLSMFPDNGVLVADLADQSQQKPQLSLKEFSSSSSSKKNSRSLQEAGVVSSSRTQKRLKVIEPSKTDLALAGHNHVGDLAPATTVVHKHSAAETFGSENWEDRWQRPDSSYIYCPAGEQIRSGDRLSQRPSDDPALVGLIVPSQTLNLTLMEDNKPPPPFFEITCSVVDIFPVYPLVE